MLSAGLVFMTLLPPLLQARHPALSGDRQLRTAEGRLFIMLLTGVTCFFGLQWIGGTVQLPGAIAGMTSGAFTRASGTTHIVVEVDPRSDKLLCVGASALVLLVGRKAPPQGLRRDAKYLAWWLQPILWLGILGTMGSALAFIHAFDAVPPWLVFMLDLVDGFEGIANLVCFVLVAWLLYYIARTFL